MRQGHRLDQPWAGGLSGKRLFLLRASELVGSELASPARGNSRSYFLALSPPKANHAQPRMKVERLQRATATCGLGNETIGLPVTPIPGGLPRAWKSLGTVRSQPPHTSAVARGTVYVQGETRGTQSVCTLPSWHVRTKCVHQTPTRSAPGAEENTGLADLSPLRGEDGGLGGVPCGHRWRLIAARAICPHDSDTPPWKPTKHWKILTPEARGAGGRGRPSRAPQTRPRPRPLHTPVLFFAERQHVVSSEWRTKAKKWPSRAELKSFTGTRRLSRAASEGRAPVFGSLKASDPHAAYRSRRYGKGASEDSAAST